jgi:hypothetical protein
MGQVFCIPIENRPLSPSFCYYSLPRVQPIRDKPFEERNIVNYYAIPRMRPLKEKPRRISIREPDKEITFYVPSWRNSIKNNKPFMVQNDLKTTP